MPNFFFMAPIVFAGWNIGASEHDRHCCGGSWHWRVAADGGLRWAVRADLSVFDIILGGVVSAGLFVYLVWALVRPEDF